MLNFVVRHKLLATLFFLNIIIVLVAVLVVLIAKSHTAILDIYIAPSEVTIEINGRQYDNFASYNMRPGDYHAKISMDGMQTKEFDFVLKDDELKRLWTYLVDENGGFGFYMTNPDDEMVLEKVADDDESQQFIDKYERTSGILDELPLEYYDRSGTDPVGIYIEQSENECTGSLLCLVVYGGEKNRMLAEGLIREAGYDPSDYKLVFEGGE